MAKFAGVYVTTRYPHHTFAKILRIWESISVEIWEQGGVCGLLVGDTKYIEVKPTLFQQLGDTNFLRPQVSFRQNDKGAITYMLFDQIALEKIHWYEGKTFLIICLVLFTLVFAAYPLVSLLHLVYWWRKRRQILKMTFGRFAYGQFEEGYLSTRGLAIAGRLIGVICCIVNLTFEIGMAFYLYKSDTWTYQIDKWGYFLLTLPNITAGLEGLMIIYCFVFLLGSRKFSIYLTGVEIIAFILLTIVLGGFTAFSVHWHFLGLN